MRHAHAFSAAALALCAAAVTCGGNVVVDGAGTTGAGDTTGTGGATGTAGSGSTCGSPAAAGDCKTDAECGGGTCASITPGGYLVCLNVPPEATSCSPPTNSGMNQCCTTADCMHGKCWSTNVYPYCGGPAKQVYNECATDQCTNDGQCVPGATVPPQICAPAGFLGVPVRTCFTAFCRTDADCTAHPCGTCAPITGPCCSFPLGMGCVYPGGCAKNADCAQGESCLLDPMTGTARCTSKPGTCPV